MKELPALREEIDEVNLKVLRLLEQRGDLVRTVAELKRRHDVELHDPKREEQMLASLCAQSSGLLGDEQIREIFTRIFAATRPAAGRGIRSES